MIGEDLVQIMEVSTDKCFELNASTRPERLMTLWIPKATNTVSYTDDLC